jgi:hypothetical protein
MSYNNEPVDSTNVSSISYDDKTRDLSVTFHNGSTYVYHGVPLSIGNAMPYTSSKGKFVWESLRGRYAFTKE